MVGEKQTEKLAELQELSKPLMEWLQENYDTCPPAGG
jgi:hypothetical protein